MTFKSNSKYWIKITFGLFFCYLFFRWCVNLSTCILLFLDLGSLFHVLQWKWVQYCTSHSITLVISEKFSFSFWQSRLLIVLGFIWKSASFCLVSNVWELLFHTSNSNLKNINGSAIPNPSTHMDVSQTTFKKPTKSQISLNFITLCQGTGCK